MRKPKRTWTEEQFTKAVENNFSVADVIRDLGLVVGGSNYTQVHRTVEELGLDTSHWTGKGHGKANNFLKPISKKPLDEILVENSSYTSSNNLKKRLFSEGLLTNCCAICG